MQINTMIGLALINTDELCARRYEQASNQGKGAYHEPPKTVVLGPIDPRIALAEIEWAVRNELAFLEHPQMAEYPVAEPSDKDVQTARALLFARDVLQSVVDQL